MRFPEYIAKQVLAQQGIMIPRGRIFSQELNLGEIWNELSQTGCDKGIVVKAQVLTGGRGKAGGVKVVRECEALDSICRSILGMTIKNEVVTGLLFEEILAIDREIYLSIALDRKQRKPVLMLSCDGGMDIEAVAANTPERILRMPLTEGACLRNWQLRMLIDFAQIPQDCKDAFVKVCKGLAAVFHQKNCSLVEINPLVITKQMQVIAADAKLVTDDNATSGAEIIGEFGYVPPEADPMDKEAAAAKLNFVRLDGTIGCMVNGAGLAMATMDALLMSGASPANFLDIGGGAKVEQVSAALDIISRTPGVKCVFINIFGGIVRCDMVAQGLLEALKLHPNWSLPIVVRLAGTNEKEARELLAQAPAFTLASSMSEGAKRAVELSKA